MTEPRLLPTLDEVRATRVSLSEPLVVPQQAEGEPIPTSYEEAVR